MDGSRRTATMDLLRRFGSDTTLSVDSLVFAPDVGHFSDSEVSTSPDWQRYRSLDENYHDAKTTIVKQLETYEPKLSMIAGKTKMEPIYGHHKRPKKHNGAVVSPMTPSSMKVNNDAPVPYQMAANLTALSNQLLARNNDQHHVHFPADSQMHGKMDVTKRPSGGQLIPLQSVQSSQSLTPCETLQRGSYEFHTEKEHRSSISETTSHLITELSEHMSVLYCILITITSACLSISATLTHNMDATISRWFNSGMLAVGIIWLLFAFAYLFRKPTKHKHSFTKKIHIIGHHHYDQPEEHPPHDRFVQNDVDSGSFYLKMGATAFAVGAMIYACLELGVYIENSSCFSWILGAYPCLFVVYVLLQLYFIFKNSQFKITSCRALSRFGLAHLVATDICVWIRTLLDETLHEFTELKQKQISKKGGNITSPSDFAVTEEEVQTQLEHASAPEGLSFHANGYQSLCVDGQSMMHEMLEAAVVFLYPCMIEYALITAGIVYIMWKSVGKLHPNAHTDSEHSHNRRHPRMFSVDCSHSANGLFAGVLIIVLTIVGLIFYFLSVNSESDLLAGLCADTMDVTLNMIGLFAVLYCSWQFCTKLRKVQIHNASMELDDGLLILTMIGVYAYSVTTIIGSVNGGFGYNILSIVNDVLELLQTTLQTVFIFDASKRSLMHVTPARRSSDRRQSDADNKQIKSLHYDKPGREVLTLLLAVNFGQWAIDIMCTLRAETSVIPKDFFGTQQWAVLLHVTVPLVIFYRFHSTVCLFDIWKHAYKVHRPPRVHRPSALAVASSAGSV